MEVILLVSMLEDLVDVYEQHEPPCAVNFELLWEQWRMTMSCVFK